MPKIVVVSASLGGIDTQRQHEPQSVPVDYYHFNDDNFNPRTAAMTPRLQARIPKMTSFEMVPGYEMYLWVDSSCRLSSPDSVKWFMEQLGDADIAVFRHPHRSTVLEEADYIQERLDMGCPYITPRYKNERIHEQLENVDPLDPLYASTAFIYRDNERTRYLLRTWWMHTSLYHSVDQLSLPHAIKMSFATVNVISDNYLKCEALEYVRNKK